MRIVHLVQSLDIGGIENLIYNISIELKKNGHDVSVISLGGDGVNSKKLKEAGIHTVNLELYSMNFTSLKILKKSIIKKSPSIIHMHSLPAGTYGRVSLLFKNIPVFYHLHTEVSKAHDFSEMMILKERFLNIFHPNIIAVSEYVKSDYSDYFKFPFKKISVLRGGVPDSQKIDKNEARRKFGLDAEKTYLTIVASLTKHKNHKYLFEIIKKIESVELLIAGNGPLKEELQNLSIKEQISDRVHFMGMVEDVQTLFSASDAAVLTSTREGLGLSLIEAQRAGIPCIGTKCGGIPEVIDHGENGILIPSDDTVAAAKMISDLLSNNSLIKSYAKKARSKFEKEFELGLYVKNLEKLYTSKTR